ncbi:galactose oxidase [Mucilaginibacter sp. PAMB04168]|uniref:galactose oxidase n=1 Tax=Mucilaginibacter sp. PAMB04168 TaxID=3138567 RepID=UPI0031F6FFEB
MSTTIAEAQVTEFKWSELAAIPDAHGFAGSFGGTSGGSMIVAGGANFPDGGAPWTGSKKVWTNQIFALEKPDGQWKVVGKLPHNLGYGVSVTWNNKLICVGGSNEAGHTQKVFALSYNTQSITIDTLPDLPYALANSSGAVAGDILYVAGGLINPDDRRCANLFLSLDLSLPTAEQRWHKLDSWPGPARMLAATGAINNTFYLFSGAELVDAQTGSVKRRYLNDAYSYTPDKGWKQLADMPWAAVAAPNSVYTSNKNVLSIFGGDDGQLAERADLKETHPGFNIRILNYYVNENQWKAGSDIPVEKNKNSVSKPNESLWAPVTVPLVIWNGKLVFPGGEVRPAVRTPRVRVATPVKH